MNLTTTLGEILKHGPCGLSPGSGVGWDKLTTTLGTTNKETPVALLQILESNGVKDALWALRCWDCRDYCLLLADIIEPSGQYSDRSAVRDVATTIRRWYACEITDAELSSARAAARAAAESLAELSSAAAAAAAAAEALADDALVAGRAAVWAAALAADAEWEAMDAEWARIEHLMRDFTALE